MEGLAHERSLGISLETGVGHKKKGPKAVYKMLVKRKKHFIAKKTVNTKKRNMNSFTTQFLLTKGVNKAAKVDFLVDFLVSSWHETIQTKSSSCCSKKTRSFAYALCEKAVNQEDRKETRREESQQVMRWFNPLLEYISPINRQNLLRFLVKT